jgi:hypothetical protein
MNAQSRIVIALDPAAPYTSGADLLQRWIRASTVDLHAEIVGLFVEDTRLLSHARSSLAREVEFSGKERALDLSALERQLRVSSNAVRKLFESVVQSLAGPRSFRVMRGDVVTEIEREAADSQALIVSVAKTPLGARPWWGADVHRLACSSCRTIVFVRDTLPASDAAVVASLTRRADVDSVVPVAMSVARAEHRPVLTVIAAHDADSAQQIRAHALEVLPVQPSPRIITVSDTTAAMLRRAIGTREDSTLVMTTRGLDSEAELVRELLATTSWDLILTRA